MHIEELKEKKWFLNNQRFVITGNLESIDTSNHTMDDQRLVVSAPKMLLLLIAQQGRLENALLMAKHYRKENEENIEKLKSLLYAENVKSSPNVIVVANIEHEIEIAQKKQVQIEGSDLEKEYNEITEVINYVMKDAD